MNTLFLIRLFLAVSGIAFVAIGINTHIDPVAAMAGLDLSPLTVTATNEVRATYGNMQLAIGLVTLAALLLPRLQSFALGLNLTITASLLSGRIVSLLVDGTPNDTVFVLIGIESVSALGAAVLLCLLHKSRA